MDHIVAVKAGQPTYTVPYTEKTRLALIRAGYNVRVYHGSWINGFDPGSYRQGVFFA